LQQTRPEYDKTFATRLLGYEKREDRQVGLAIFDINTSCYGLVSYEQAKPKIAKRAHWRSLSSRMDTLPICGNSYLEPGSR
jgi:hypothetical protein